MSDPYGPRTGQYGVELHVRATLAKWLPTEVVRTARRYAAMGDTPIDPGELEAMLAAGQFPFAPRGISITSNFDDWPVDALPHVQIIVPGYTRAGTDQDGIANSYEIQIANMVGAQDRDDTRFIRACYEDAIPTVMVQHQGLEGLPGAGGTTLGAGGAAEFDTDEKDSRNLQGSIVVCDVLVHGVLHPRNGPSTPDPLPVVDPGQVPPPDAPYPTVVEDGATVELDPQDLA